MVKNSIKVYARLKKENGKKKLANYIISRRDEEYEDILFPHNLCADATNNKYQKYRFRRVFSQDSEQSEIFDAVAKPIINSVINGFNGTVLAYGQTGSGKTFAITGSPTKYDDRGIIPRSIQQIFDLMSCSSDHYNIYISYLEIYHEIGYDLLNTNQEPSFLEELPRIVLLEDAHGEAHLRNLSVLPVANEQEAMRLLFLGDTNRSERINKSNISGIALNEAKHINLSLHYLEQVILALSQPNRPHIPFRNSMMTYILRDSLSGNSLTAMLATLAITQKNLEETITTCKFAQRVACISTEAVINEEIDPQQEIIFLKNELDELRRRLTSTKGTNSNEKLTSGQENRCKKAVKNYLQGSDEIGIDLDVRQIKLCFTLFKDLIKKKEKSQGNTKNLNAEIMEKYLSVIKEKDEEICTLKELLAVKPTSTVQKGEVLHTETPNTIEQIKQSLTSIEKQALEVFMMDQSNRKELCSIQNHLEQKYSIAERVALTIQKCQSNIIDIRNKLKANTSNREITEKLKSFLISQQNVYRESILQLQALKFETDYLKRALEQAEIKIFHKFKDWINPDVIVTENGQNKSTFEKDVFACIEECNSFINQISSELSDDNRPKLIKSVNETNLCTNLYDANNTHSLINNLEPELLKLDKYKYARASSNLGEMFSARQSYLKSSGIPSRNILMQQPSNRQNVCPQNIQFEHATYCGDMPNKNSFLEKYSLSNTLKPYPEELAQRNPAKSPSFGDENFDTNQTIPVREQDALKAKDSSEFTEFMKTVPLTGDAEVDDEIFNFYRKKLKVNADA